MGQKEKLIARLRTRPRDFTLEEMERLLGYLGFERDNKGKTSGSRVRFVHQSGAKLMIHLPHLGNQLRVYQVKALLEMLEKEGLI
jgi:hypothetical protein